MNQMPPILLLIAGIFTVISAVMTILMPFFVYGIYNTAKKILRQLEK